SIRSSFDQSKENSNNSNKRMTSNGTVISLEEGTLLEDNVNEIEIETINDNSSPSSIPSSRILTDQNKIISIPVEKVIRTESTFKRARHSATYQRSWKQKEEAMYKTYEFDLFGVRTEKIICWLYSTDNISMRCRLCEKYTKAKNRVHNGVIEKLRQKLDGECMESSPCVAHTFSLVGSQAAYSLTDDNKIGPISPSVSKLESSISKIYNYFSRSSSCQTKLKNWHRFFEQPELRFKRLFDIRWSCIRDSIKPIIENIQPNSQALFIVLEEISADWMCSSTDRETASELRKQLLRDEFLFIIHFHHDLHECVLGPVTKIEQQPPMWGSSLSNYIRESKKHFYGQFKIEPADRKKLSRECFDHIERLLQELDRRFIKYPLLENLSISFDPNYLMDHKEIVDQPEYGRKVLNYLREKYKNLPSFDKTAVHAEWELIKIPLAEYLKGSITHTRKHFWKSFILFKQTINERFIEQFKNIVMLLSIYLLSASNSAECERGFSAANRVQTNGRSRLMVETLDVLLNVRLLLTDEIRRCQFVAEKAFEPWNDYESKRRYTRTKLLIDVADDYEPATQKYRPIQK
ncbi:unnamed protein product, partial [Rotaria sp. Silwood2]